MKCPKKNCFFTAWIFAALAGFLPAAAQADLPQRELVYVGSGHRNIYAFWLDMTSGSLTSIGEVAEIAAPSFLAISPDHQNLYAISEGQTTNNSFISAFQMNLASGQLAPLNTQATGGAGPCYVAVDQSGRDVLVANYNSGSEAVFPIIGQGALGPMSSFIQDKGSSVNPQRQTGPHAHCIVTDASDAHAFECDLGTDKIMIFKFDPAHGTLVAGDLPFVSVKPGSGPRHIAFHPTGKYAFVANEMASTLTGFLYDSAHGTLLQKQELSLLPLDFKGQNTAAEVAVHPSGNFVYASNRGDNSIVEFTCNPESGWLTFSERTPTGGKTPRNFEIDPTGTYLLAANQDSGTVLVFSIDKSTGHLKPTGAAAAVDLPMCVKCIIPGIIPLATP